jgi:hypothetical protein
MRIYRSARQRQLGGDMVDMYRKSIDYYTFIGAKEFSDFFEVPREHGKKTRRTSFDWKKDFPFQSAKTDIANDDIGRIEHSGRFRWEASQNRGSKSVKLGGEFWEISPLTGSMQVDKYPDSPTEMMRTTSKFSAKDNWAYSYGFYDSGAGIGELTNHDQCYVYVTPDVSNWMGDLTKGDAAASKSLAAARFSTFVLPGSHDAGTYDLTIVKKFAHDAAFLGLIRGLTGLAITKVLEPFAVEIVQNFSVTQKDDVKTQLDMGARYFDFRPGYCALRSISDSLFHQHGPIPGVSYDTFLKDLFVWLVAHPSEIAVLCIGFAGFSDASMKPTYQTLDATLKKAQKAANADSIIVTNHHDLNASYSDLIKYRKRLFVIYAPETGAPQTAKKYDCYNGDTYATTNPQNIITALNTMKKSGQAGYDYTVLQLQGTASLAGGGAVGTVVNTSKSGSPLMSTKPTFDSQTYPWLIANARQKLGDAQLIVCLNDFVDNALAMQAMRIMAPGRF